MAFTINGTTGINLGTEPLTGSLPDANAPSGSVLQVVSATMSSEATTSGTSFTDTGLSATIIPISTGSKILIIATHNSGKNGGGGFALQIKRNGTDVVSGKEFGGNTLYTGNTTDNRAVTTINYLDSPSTTSAITYKTQFRNPMGTGLAYIALNDTIDSIVIMEIAA